MSERNSAISTCSHVSKDVYKLSFTKAKLKKGKYVS